DWTIHVRTRTHTPLIPSRIVEQTHGPITRAPPSRLMRCSCESAFGALSFLSPPRTPSRLRIGWARFRLAEVPTVRATFRLRRTGRATLEGPTAPIADARERATGAGHAHDGIRVPRRGDRRLCSAGAPQDSAHRGPS